MKYAKHMLLVTTFLLGSCVPITPRPAPPSITIYNTFEATPAQKGKVIKSRKTMTCKRTEAYIIPDKPTLDDLADGDDQGVVDRLNAHIDFLRAELKTQSTISRCGK